MAGAGGGEHSKFTENQKARRPLLARGLGVIARRGKVGPRVAPIVGALRRPLGIHHLGEPMDNNVQKTAHQQAEYKNQPG